MNIARLIDPNDPNDIGYDDNEWIACVGQDEVENWLADMFTRPEGLKVIEVTQNVVQKSREP